MTLQQFLGKWSLMVAPKSCQIFIKTPHEKVLNDM
uniref:Uncharacterized protein n=1 Tax=Rhizophora mucronata TaxID=61149 RepID=A0A2P2P9S5_RHIMU